MARSLYAQRKTSKRGIEFPTVVQPEPGIIDKWKSRPAGRVEKRPKDEYGKAHWFGRMDIPGLMALLAQSDYDSGGWSREEWLGTNNKADALHLAEYGWMEPVPAILAQANRLLAKQTRSLIPVLTYVDEPGEPDIAAYVEGEEECFLTTSEGLNDTPVAGRAVKIILEPCVSQGTSSRSLIARGAMIAAVAHSLECSGIRVALEYRSLMQIDPYEHTEMDAQIEVVLKHYGEPFDIRGRAFWLVHPSASRRFVFAAGYAGNKRSRSHGIGWAERNPPFLPNETGFTRHTTFEHEGSLEKWAAAAFKMAGIELEGGTE